MFSVCMYVLCISCVEGHVTKQNTLVEEEIPLSDWLKPKPTSRKNVLSPLPQQKTAPDIPSSHLKLYSPSPNAQHYSDYEENDEINEQKNLSETLKEEWDSVNLKKMQG